MDMRSMEEEEATVMISTLGTLILRSNLYIIN